MLDLQKHKGMDNHEDSIKKKAAGSRPGPNPGRVKRVVSSKRKTHHLHQKKVPGPGKPHAAANNQNELNSKHDMEHGTVCMDPWDLSQDKHKTGRTGPEPPDYSLLSEIPKDHNTMTNILFGRNLRLKVAFTLWRRNVGELITYFLRYKVCNKCLKSKDMQVFCDFSYRIQDFGAFVDFLPVITKSITEGSPTVSIGCCVDLFPLVKKVLSNPYEEYIVVGLKWIHSVLKNWWEELKESGLSGCAKVPLDKNFQLFNQQLLELWHQEPLLKSVPESAANLAMAIESFISQMPL